MKRDAEETRPGHKELGRVLVAGGVLAGEWIPAFEAVPRAAFLPELIWPFDMETGRSVPVSWSAEPGVWSGYAEADVPIVTQWDDGAHTGTEPGEVATSSASMPSVVFRMLRDLDVRPGQRVLEIGTGTGWNAALLAQRAGSGQVVSVEVDPGVAERARAALDRFGCVVEVVQGDGLLGHPAGGPYERTIATCGLRELPFAWVEQSRPGAVIVAPWGTHHGNGDAAVRLVVADDGASATGRFTGPVEFMKARAQRLSPVEHSAYVGEGERETSGTTVTERDFLGEGRFAPQRFAVGLRVRECVQVVAEKRDGRRAVWLYGLTDRSWACVQFRDAGSAQVWQAGPRRLWDEAEAAYRWWEENGRPGHGRFGLTVRPGGQWAWLDDPEGADAWPV
ncbi:methyltransferase domain-containing protein [Streptomyces sp. LP05-1]|uniref:Protein-L-isoaspartate O-methyltransferase n=1 Tax=Streptomyces pyxinae TaxID=2970734 RepID=A0ABT2CJZ4_9ACTN|nr:methyltransferase domain-containing protein [Streptomyces sp. LP05-1]MCS0637036.1 methyltransferase domain-containing protein [Streptomyces sp. LP05-1]